MLRPFLSGMQQALQNMTPDDLARMRQMLQDLNRMLREKADGREPDFDAFKAKWGQFFPGAESLDDLLEQMGRQIAQMQSLLASMSPEQRGQLEEMMRQTMLRDERLEAALSQLAMHLEDLLPLDRMRRAYDFRGDEEMTLQQAMDVMEELQRLDRLERELKGVREPGDLERIDREEMEKAPAGADQEARGGRLPGGKGRRAPAHRARDPQDRRQGARRHLRPPQARPVRAPRRESARRGR
jgi:uncharacterized protein with von Willebrand factor type A (vWA) domain